MAKKIEKAVVQDNIVFTDPTKHKRAVGILAMLNGKPATAHLRSEYSDAPRGGGMPSSLMELVGKFEAILKEAGIAVDDEAKALVHIYKKLGGAVSTPEREAKIRASMKKLADSKKAAEDADGKEEEDEDEPKDDAPADEDDE